ncbi:hypothetical protein OH768_45500 [Streptomyces sp. NBC_01622]|nr:hypothetical protein OH768_45500 [Streptomyces sp. NBC_01622]
MELLLVHLAGSGREACVVGLFGDSMQKIYPSGVGAVTHPKLTPITKHENYRCSPPVVAVLNKMRPELLQEAAGERRQGAVHLFLNADTEPGLQRLEVARAALAEHDWTQENTKYLMLTHRAIAGRLDYANLLEQYRRVSRFGPDDLLTRNEPYIKYLTRIEALSAAYRDHDFAELTSLLGEGRTRITRHGDKQRISKAIGKLDTVRETGTIGDVLDLMADSHLLVMPGKLKERERRRKATDLDERAQRRADFSNSVREVSYQEVISVTRFINEETPFSTQHGVKGDESRMWSSSPTTVSGTCTASARCSRAVIPRSDSNAHATSSTSAAHEPNMAWPWSSSTICPRKQKPPRATGSPRARPIHSHHEQASTC